MSSRKKKFIKISSYTALVFILLLTLLVISLKILVPVLVNNSLKSLSSSKEVDLSVKKLEFSLKDGIKIKKLQLSDKEINPFEIGELFIKPDYFSSIKEKKIILKNVDLGSTNLDASGKSLSSIKRLFKGEDDKKEDSESRLHIKNINIEDFAININESLRINLNNLDIDWNKAEKNNLDFNINGLIAVNENESSSLSGKILVDQIEKSADVDFVLDSLARQITSNQLTIPHGLAANISTNINYLTDIKSNGDIIFSSNKKRDFGKLSYDLIYNNLEGDLFLENIDLAIKNFLSLTAKGSVKKVNDTKDFDISSELKIDDLNKLAEWTKFLETTELKGKLETKRITVSGSRKNKNLNIVADGKIDDGSFSNSRYSAENLKLDFNFSRNFSQNKNLVALDFDAKKLRLDLPGDSNTSLEKLFTEDQLNLKIYNEADGNLKVEGDKFNFEKIRHDYFSSTRGTVEDFAINLKDGGKFNINGFLNGRSFSAKGFKVADVDIDFNIEKKSEGTFTTGELNLRNGSFKTFLLDKYEGDFTQNSKIVKLHNSSIKSNHPSRAVAELVTIKIPDEGRSDIEVDFKNATLFELQDKIKSKIKKANLTVNSQTADIRGKVEAENLSYKEQGLKYTSFNLELVSQKLKLKNIESNFFNGNLRGDINLDINKRPYAFSSNLKLFNPVIKTEGSGYPVKSLATNFKGSLDSQLINAKGSINLKELKITKDIYESNLNSEVKLDIKDETISIESGFINSEESKKINFKGEINSFLSDKKKVELDFDETELSTLKKVLYPFLPFEIQEGDLTGTIKPRIGVNENNGSYDWIGNIKIKNAGLDTLLSLTELSVSGVNGVFTLDNKSFSKNPISDVLGGDFNIDKEVYKKYFSKLKEKNQQESSDFLKIEEINYSFFNIKNIEALFEMNSSKININYLKSDTFRGNVVGAGVLNLDKQKYNFSLLFDDLSLDSISDSIPSIKDYITGRFNGMVWINAGNDIGKVDGLFSLWAIKSEKEKLSLGKPLLEKIGATGRFFTGSSRTYDKGLISGYIKEGFMTFKELEITNSILGYKDLSIRVDKKKNSISLNQMFSVIREIAKRASEGGIKIDFEN